MASIASCSIGVTSAEAAYAERHAHAGVDLPSRVLPTEQMSGICQHPNEQLPQERDECRLRRVLRSAFATTYYGIAKREE
jgi:hypothetical protein